MLKMAGIMEGSIAAVVNSKPAPNKVSGFYPHPQRGRIKSATVQSRGPAGTTHRITQFEMQSVLQTNIFRRKKWAGSPYANELAVGTKTKESMALQNVITTKPPKVRRIVIRGRNE